MTIEVAYVPISWPNLPLYNSEVCLVLPHVYITFNVRKRVRVSAIMANEVP